MMGDSNDPQTLWIEQVAHSQRMSLLTSGVCSLIGLYLAPPNRRSEFAIIGSLVGQLLSGHIWRNSANDYLLPVITEVH